MEKKINESGIDLSNVKGSMANALHDDIKNLDKCKTVSDVYNFVERVVGPVVGHGTSEVAYKKLLNSVRNARMVEKAMFAVTSFYLKGSDLGVI